MPYDLNDPKTWPDATVVVRGGINELEELRDALLASGGISVISRPDVPFEELAASVRNNRLRRTTVKAVLGAGGALSPTFGDDEPPNHCDLFGLTAEQLNSILAPSELNPVPKEQPWRGSPR